MKSLKINSRSVFGIFIVVIGGILLLSNLGILTIDLSLVTFWPVILIVIGIVKLVNFDESTSAGVILLILGVYFQLKNLNVEFIEDLNLWSIILPTIIIMVGLSMLLDSDKPRVNRENYEKHHATNGYDDVEEDEEYRDVDID